MREQAVDREEWQINSPGNTQQTYQSNHVQSLRTMIWLRWTKATERTTIIDPWISRSVVEVLVFWWLSPQIENSSERRVCVRIRMLHLALVHYDRLQLDKSKEESKGSSPYLSLFLSEYARARVSVWVYVQNNDRGARWSQVGLLIMIILETGAHVLIQQTQYRSDQDKGKKRPIAKYLFISEDQKS